MYGGKNNGQTSSRTELGARRKYCHYEAKFKRRAVMVDLQDVITYKFCDVAATEWDELKLKIHP